MKIFLAESAPPELALSWTDGLREDKKARIDRMRRREDQALALTAHRLLCYALKTACGIVPTSNDFDLGARGKPFLKDRPDIHFNISHSGAMALCALHEAPVGADIEKIRPVGAGVAKRILTAAEQQVYVQTEDKQNLFFQIWTLKEAYIKYLGTGLGVALSSVTAYPVGTTVLTDTGCAFMMVNDITGYQAAVCTQSKVVPSVRKVDTDSLVLF
jgi:4'-phosphopantetheinyl transferase